MKALVLSPYPERLVSTLSNSGDEYAVLTRPVTPEECRDEGFDFLVSYGYRHMLKKEVLDLFEQRAINLHISLLPFCRGSHPVFWSVVEEKPLGVTIHMLDEGLDTGNILFQQSTPMTILPKESFASLYAKQRDAIELLFEQSWKYLRTGECSGWRQQGTPTQHRSRELNQWLELMPRKWETPIREFCEKAGISHPQLDYGLD